MNNYKVSLIYALGILGGLFFAWQSGANSQALYKAGLFGIFLVIIIFAIRLLLTKLPAHKNRE